MKHLRLPDAERGFTLVELLVAIAIGVILTGTLATTLILGLRTTEEAGVQVMEASWAQIVGSWFLTDVHGSESFSPGPEFACYALGSPPEDAIGLVGSFAWTAPDHFDAEPAVQTHADWWLLDEDGAEGDGSLILTRTTCTFQGPTLMDGPDREFIAQHTEDATIACDADGDDAEDGRVCTLTWTASLSPTASGRDDRTYQVTALRRLGS
jgi:prepilin-type N-terminal cleavage/methylation domain-containing protein